ncbi:pilus assembly protein [Tardiphaga sp. vice352]|uniref:TadE/TadG family type IV pilus assembly protein n=1 Tax=unclassified Tardiphaga TaxID=2631404 RepID=UPI00116442CB|nr:MULTISPECIES: pilus assembly protein TadG-related protein [unclassified Tardiphaga]QDM18086.1 pilus assembly protein [Tardiphaga sp. vice278]QDM23123.1 pilus assembly protein [Tardiphaga sp. vice154]QDM28295.1 pilus assembly protein [Tardiphaga sp. vice304]QDM33434.1 pilus assembly protein [Tardiphaga sp. vice352]
MQTGLVQLLSRFRRDERGSIALLYGITVVPLIITIGCAVDYTRAASARAALQGAADAAGVAAVSAKSPGFLAAQAMTSDGQVSSGVTDATQFFNGRTSTIGGVSNLSPTITVVKDGKVVKSTVAFTAKVATTFMGIAGWSSMTVSGSSSSEASLPTFLDFYLMLDVSGSMGLPSTNAEQTRLAAINPDNYKSYPNGCTFACHFTANNACSDSDQKYSTGGKCMGFPLSRTAGNSGNSPVGACSTPGTSACIQLRADAVGYAVQQLLITANTTAKVANQFRIGLYPYIQKLYAYFALTSAISGSATNSSTINYAAANLATLLDTGQNATLGSGGTHFENAFPTMNSLVTSVGTGSTATDTLPFVFLVTDGAQNNQTQWGGGWAGDNHATVVDKNLCNAMKTRGITISVLYIPYQPIQNPTSFGNNEDYYVNAIIPNIPTALSQCASPGFFFTANTPDDITTALNKMFQQALVSAHITN